PAGGLRHDQRQKVGNGAAFDDKVAIHVGFAEAQLGIQNNAPLGGRLGEPDEHRGAGSVSQRKGPPPHGRYDERSAANERSEDKLKQPVHRPAPLLDYDRFNASIIAGLCRLWPHLAIGRRYSRAPRARPEISALATTI